MVLIVKRLVPVFKTSDKVPKKWRNLKKAAYVTTFKYAYKTIPGILQREYGLKPDEKIVVFWTKAVPKPGWSEWRLPFRKVYSGQINKLLEHFDKLRRNQAAAHCDSKKIVGSSKFR